MKRYIFFIGTLRNGGAERVVSMLANQMAEQGRQVEILTFYDRPVFYNISSKVMLTSVEKHKKGKIKGFFWIRRYFKENAEVVLSFLAPFNMLSIMAVCGLKVPIVVADRNDPTKVPENFFVRKLRDFLYLFADGVVLQTEDNRDYFNRKIQEKSAVIYNPVNMGDKIGIALNASKDKLIVSAGRLMPQKNQKMLIEAFSEVVKKHPEYKLIIYGEGPDREKLESLIEELNLKNQVMLPGNVSDLHDRMKNAEMFVLSSDYEGMPNALIEAMCIGLPVISTKVSGTRELIELEKNGTLVDCKDKTQLEKAIEDLILNMDKRSFFACENVKLAEKLKIDVITGKWLELIREITN